MPRIIRELVMQTDPDFRDTVMGAINLIRDAYDRGAISWARRGELIGIMEDGGSGLFEVREYEKPHPDPKVMCFGVFLEPTPTFLAEIGAPTWPSPDL